MRKFLAALLLLPALACAQILSGTSTSTGFGATPGISGQLTQPSFAAALTTTIAPAISSAGANGTFTRATTATVVDQDQIVRSVLSGEVRFGGARRVRNLVSASENIQGGGWGVSGTAVRLDAQTVSLPAVNDILQTSFLYATGDLVVFSVTLSGSGQVTIDVSASTSSSGGGTQIVLTSTPTRYAIPVATTTGAGGNARIWRKNAADTATQVTVQRAQVEIVNGQSNTNLGEYVSVGVLSAPFQGANVDGVQYFGTYNTNVLQQNISLRSQQFTAAAWSPANVTVAEDVATAPDGTLTADSLTATLTNACRNSEASGVTAGQIYTASGYFKSTSNVMGFISIDNGGGSVTAYVKGTLTGSGATSTGGAGTVVASSITSVGSSWYRLSLTFVADSSSTRFSLGVWNPASADASGYPGAVLGDKVFAWGSQINPGAFAATYVPTTTVAINNNIVETGLAPQIPSATLLGYLAEGLRTNLSLSSTFLATWAPSRATLTAGAVVSPDGATAGATLIEDATATNTHFIAQTVSLTAATVYTWSVWGKTGPGSKRWLALNSDLINVGFEQGIVDLSTCAVSQQAFGSSVTVKAYPAGWCYITASGASRTTGIINFQFMLANAASGAGAITYNGDNTSGNAIWGAQVEAGAFSSTYIPTALATVTRNLDVLTYPTAGHVVTGTGSAYAEFTLPIASTVTNQYALDLNSGGNRPPIYYSIGGTLGMFDGTTQNLSPAFSAGPSPQKVASNWGGATMNNFAKGVAGTPTAFDGTMEPGANMLVGNGNVSVTVAYGNVKNLLLWLVKLTDAQLQGLTGP